MRIWEGAPSTGRRVGTIQAGATWRVLARQDAWAVRNAAGALVGGHLWGGPGTDLVLTYENAGARVFVPEADAIWGKGFAYARGTIEMNLTSCGDANGCMERMIARLGLEDYLLGIGEVPASWPMESLRAQADAARTYAAYSLVHYGLRAECNCDLTDGSSDQTYMGYSREAGTDGARWAHAVTSTAGEVITYHGALIQAFYAASDGGHTDSVQDVWHGGNPAYAIPWLTGVCDPGEATAANPWTEWSTTMSAADVTSRLAPYTGSIGTVARFTSVRRGEGGRVITAVATGSTGSATVTGAEMKSALGWYDERVWINSNRTIVGRIRSAYDDLGCRPGLPSSPQQNVTGGAQQFFVTGGLYANAAKGLTVWLHGPIDNEFRAVDAAAGVLGVPAGRPVPIGGGATARACGQCRRVSFVGGRIYMSPATGARALWGPVLTAYLGRGGATSTLGLPVTRVIKRPNGRTRASFQHGSIVCPASGACTINAT